jgi:hypothetical protein
MMNEVFERAKEQAERFGITNVLVATNTGSSVKTAQDVMGDGFRYFAVGNPSSSRAKGLVLHDGISPATRAELERRGITVVLQDVPAFVGHEANEIFHRANRAYIERFGRTFEPGETVPSNICKVMVHVLSEFFGDGPRVCMETALMAADSGLLPLDEDCMAIARPSKYAHAALIIRPVRSAALFSTHFRVKDLLLVPGDDDTWFSDGPIP